MALARRLAERSGGNLGMEVLAAGVDVLGAVAVALVGCAFLCVLFRCVGLLGRYHPEILESLPEEPLRGAELATFVGAGIAASLGVHYAIYLLMARM